MEIRRLDNKRLEISGHSWIHLNFYEDAFLFYEFCRKERSDLIRKGKMQIGFVNSDKTTNARRNVALFFELCSFLSVEAPSLWSLRYTEFYSHSSSYCLLSNCLFGLGRAVIDQKQGRNLWHGIVSHSSHIISACWLDVWNVLNKGMWSGNSSKRKGFM